MYLKAETRFNQVFTPKDKLGDWFEYYAGVLELNVWTGTSIKTSEWSESARQWTVTLNQEKDGSLHQSNQILLNHYCRANEDVETVRPRHIVLATGHSGEPYLPSHITGIDEFKGDRLIHSSQFSKPEENAKGKKAVIVGCCNSGHDIARDYHDHGYDVTMVQRSSTLVVACETLMDVTMKGLYDEDGVKGLCLSISQRANPRAAPS